MPKFGTVLCVVDPEQPDSPAVRRAAWLASTLGAEVDLLAVHYNETLLNKPLRKQSLLEASRTQAVEDIRRRLEPVAAQLGDANRIKVTANVIWDHPVHEGIVRYASASGADIVIKDARHHSALRIAMLSNQDWQLIRCCQQPLWIVKRDTLPERLRFIAAVDPLHKHDKPAALDETILRLGQSLATATRGSLHVLHAFDPRIAMSAAEHNAYIPVSLPLSDIEDQIRELHASRFDQVIYPYDIADERRHLVTGLPDEEIPRLATRLDAVAVVMGAIARNPLKRLFIGSTAERMLNRLTCDLIVVKPDWFETPVRMQADDELAASTAAKAS